MMMLPEIPDSCSTGTLPLRTGTRSVLVTCAAFGIHPVQYHMGTVYGTVLELSYKLSGAEG